MTDCGRIGEFAAEPEIVSPPVSPGIPGIPYAFKLHLYMGLLSHAAPLSPTLPPGKLQLLSHNRTQMLGVQLLK